MTTRYARPIVAGVLAFVLVAAGPALAADPPAGQMTWALHFTLAPTLFEPAETAGLITPFMIIYALHDALVKPMPGKIMTPSLAESWTASPDGLTYEFLLRKGVKFHTGDRIQQLVHDKAMVLPIWQLALLQGVGPRVAESGLGLIADYPWSAPYEDLKLKK